MDTRIQKVSGLNTLLQRTVPESRRYLEPARQSNAKRPELKSIGSLNASGNNPPSIVIEKNIETEHIPENNTLSALVLSFFTSTALAIWAHTSNVVDRLNDPIKNLVLSGIDFLAVVLGVVSAAGAFSSNNSKEKQ